MVFTQALIAGAVVCMASKLAPSFAYIIPTIMIIIIIIRLLLLLLLLLPMFVILGRGGFRNGVGRSSVHPKGYWNVWRTSYIYIYIYICIRIRIHVNNSNNNNSNAQSCLPEDASRPHPQEDSLEANGWLTVLTIVIYIYIYIYMYTCIHIYIYIERER